MDKPPQLASIEADELPPLDTAHILLAGIMLEQGLAEKRVAKRWRSSVLDGVWQPEDCAQEVLTNSSADRNDPRLRQRAVRLLRDFLMAPMQSGVRGAARKGRAKLRSGLAYVVTQLFVLGLFTLIICAVGILLRMRGKSLDGWADWVLELF